MRLLIISHTPHYRTASGGLVGWGPTVREIDRLSTRFSSVRHIACLHDEPPPPSALPYARDVAVIGLPPVAGIDVLRTAPHTARVILRELAQADAVHVRSPANIALIANLLLPIVRAPRARWIKFAGNWRPPRRESLSVGFQRWWLRRAWHRGEVTVNGEWPGDPPHVHAFFNPSFDERELAAARGAGANKSYADPLHLLFVGRLEPAKGPSETLDAFAKLVARGRDATLDVVGDGPDRAALEARATRDELRVTFHGWRPPEALRPLYARAHFLVLPTKSEGWPKVISEAMAHGAVPITAAISAIPQTLARFGIGRALSPCSADAIADAIEAYDAVRWRAESARAMREAAAFTYEAYLAAVDALMTASR